MNKKYIATVIVILMAVVIVSGCTTPEPPGDNPPDEIKPSDNLSNGNDTGLPSPEFVYCEKDQSGIYQSVETPLGSKGYCSIPDGRTCEALPFFNSNGEECIPYEEA